MRFRFGTFVLDVDGHRLNEDGRERHLTPKAFALLTALVRAPVRVHSKAELHQWLWPDAFVSEANLSNLLAEVRGALGDDAAAPRFIRTVHRVGYAFIADVTSVSDSTITTAMVTMWLEWGHMRFPLGLGVHVIGRESDADVELDATTVSRRHARLLVTSEGARLEDLKSKNGTYRGDSRVIALEVLRDGDELRFGDVLVTFRSRSIGHTTKTGSVSI